MLNERKILGEKIRKIRLSRYLSQEDVGLECDFSGACMGDIERAESDFKISKLFKIAKALNVDVKTFFEN